MYLGFSKIALCKTLSTSTMHGLLDEPGTTQLLHVRVHVEYVSSIQKNVDIE